MPAIYSKPLLNDYAPVPDGWKEGGINDGDFHCWVKDKGSGHIYDPHFGGYGFIINVRNCEVEWPIYQEWPNQDKWRTHHIFNKVSWCRDLFNGKNITMKKIKSIKTFDFLQGKPVSVLDFVYEPQFKQCPYNAVALYSYMISQGRDVELCVGSMGWRRKGNWSQGWWEFG
tara:strand:- start:795 stop:1307 length:513 start_codon:yes stop_codon:yes gene_type:complete